MGCRLNKFLSEPMADEWQSFTCSMQTLVGRAVVLIHLQACLKGYGFELFDPWLRLFDAMVVYYVQIFPRKFRLMTLYLLKGDF